MPNKILGQTRPAVANSLVVIYTVPANTEVTGMVMTIANVDGINRDFRITQDSAGGVPGNSFALAWDVAITADTFAKVSIGPMNTASGEIAVSSGSNNSCVFTLHGNERLVT